MNEALSSLILSFLQPCLQKKRKERKQAKSIKFVLSWSSRDEDIQIRQDRFSARALYIILIQLSINIDCVHSFCNIVFVFGNEEVRETVHVNYSVRFLNQACIF